MQIAGRRFSEEILERIREAVRSSAELTRYGLSRLVCEWIDWRDQDGRAKESSCRAALVSNLINTGHNQFPIKQAALVNLEPQKRGTRWPYLN